MRATLYRRVIGVEDTVQDAVYLFVEGASQMLNDTGYPLIAPYLIQGGVEIDEGPAPFSRLTHILPQVLELEGVLHYLR